MYMFNVNDDKIQQQQKEETACMFSSSKASFHASEPAHADMCLDLRGTHTQCTSKWKMGLYGASKIVASMDQDNADHCSHGVEMQSTHGSCRVLPARDAKARGSSQNRCEATTVAQVPYKTAICAGFEAAANLVLEH